MRVPDNAELLDLWDAGQHASPMRRTLLLLRAACPGEQEIEHWRLGVLNARLLALRAQLFGPELVCLADCSVCGTVCESCVSVPTLLSHAEQHAANTMASLYQVKEAGCNIRFRLPCAHDLLSLDRHEDAGTALLARVVEHASRDGQTLHGEELPAAARVAIEQCIEQADPLAHIDLALTCPACGHRWNAALHAIDMLWMEIGALTRRLLSEVGRLAQAFGWREADILAMTPQRRRSYLEWLGT